MKGKDMSRPSGKQKKISNVAKNEKMAQNLDTKQDDLEKRILIFFYLFILVAMTLSVFWQLRDANFLDMDDHVYVYENETIKKGMTLENFKWAFSTLSLGFYFPVTILSHLLDVQMFGLNPGGHHLTSVTIHCASVCLLFLFLIKTTRKQFNSFVVAGIFAIHPLRVESVAWIAERKDVLSAMFFLLTLLLYLFYVEKRTMWRYALVFVSFLLGLLSKPMIVTLPFVLLLIDFWPLNRFKLFSGDAQNGKAIWRSIYEKIPFFILITIFSYVSYIAQKSVQAVVPIGEMPMKTRILNAFISYVQYLIKTLYPTNLALFYPFPKDGVSTIYGLFSLLILIFLTASAIYFGKKRQYLITGWFWYLGILVPVIGIVQIGGQAMADRYTYLSTIGFIFAVVWLIYELVKNKKMWRTSAVILSIVALGGCLRLTYAQVGLWKDSEDLYRHSLKATKDNYIMHYNLGSLLFKEGKTEEAIEHFREVLKIRQDLGDVHLHLGFALGKTGQYEEAIVHLKRAMQLLPNSFEAHSNLGKVYEEQGKGDSAMKEYEEAIKINPKDEVSLTNLGILTAQKGDLTKAVEYFEKAIESKLGYIDAHNSLGVAFLRMGEYQKAYQEFENALKIDPHSQFAKNNLERVEEIIKKKGNEAVKE